MIMGEEILHTVINNLFFCIKFLKCGQKTPEIRITMCANYLNISRHISNCISVGRDWKWILNKLSGSTYAQ